ncbi:YolD-like family protein [Paenibacillus sp. FSL L8-0470]|uniref:YolD-like family protein n=1 Tax=unclassified Paenibacillus TaxID=185978 RepID=UPI0030F6F9BA
MKKFDSIFDCSRVMTPEHKRRIIQDEERQRLRSKPVLDAQEWELIDQVLAYSKRYNEQITITLFDPEKDHKIRGVVMSVDLQMRQVKLQIEYEYDWIMIDDVIQATT